MRFGEMLSSITGAFLWAMVPSWLPTVRYPGLPGE
jgi:hypothetical protein